MPSQNCQRCDLVNLLMKHIKIDVVTSRIYFISWQTISSKKWLRIVSLGSYDNGHLIFDQTYDW